ncbi:MULTISPECIES: hypothetical protein [unclassified Rhizobium]|uniref:hypothetical protein n=1 Tax=unclassified Rhizobium TaxID=2613769 RepID=UPI001ADC3310|nr:MULTISPECIES: hypothetical protein [unclassified Rhizobium]MBO9124920.1 hypothetical protein [Rhizobium sp. 16-488-2b]MBO9175505.1 hypothetical protein [Rhizobium sp. 16-488-2a]
MNTAKHVFAGARTLALQAEEFQELYPQLAADVAEYVSCIKSPIKRKARELSVRLILGFIEEEESFHGLRDHLRNPKAAADQNLYTDELRDAVQRSHKRLVGSGLYSAGAAREHARKGIGVFRWLAEAKGNYPALPRGVQLERAPRQNRLRNNKGAEPPIDPMSVEEIGSLLGATFLTDLTAFGGVRNARGTAKSLGFRYLMAFLKANPSNYSDTLLTALSGDPNTTCEAPVVKAVIDECEAFLRKSGAFAHPTLSSLMRNCGYLFEFLAELKGRAYPHYSRRYKKFGHIPTEGKTIADIDIVGATHLTGAPRLRRSMEIVRDAAMEVVRSNVRYFKAMAPARDDQLLVGASKAEVKAFSAVATVLRAEVRSLEATRVSQFSKLGLRTNGRAVDKAMTVLADPVVWQQMGVSEFLPSADCLSFQQIMQLVCAAIGATNEAVLASKVVFATETGWNAQPIEDIPGELFVFRLKDKAGIASASFVSVFKKRAGHHVQAFLEHSTLSEGRGTDALATWEDAERDRPWQDFDQRHLLSYTSPAFEMIELMRPLMEPLTELTSDEGTRSRFFKYLGWNTAVSTNQGSINSQFKTGVLGTRGLSLKLIRKSFLEFNMRVVGSVESLRSVADHAGTGVLLPHYLNSKEMRRELEQSTRFFQNAIQALIAAEVGSPLQVAMSAEEQEWFYNLAMASGVGSACGYGVTMPVVNVPSLVFDPTDDQVRSLLALSLSLDAEEPNANPRRWRLIGIPLRGFIQAIETKLKRAGASRLLTRICKELVNDVRAARTVLPPLNLSGGY